MNIGKSINTALKSRNESKIELCRSTGISKMSISNWTRGKPILSDHLELLCMHFDMKVSEFIRLGE